MSSSSKEMIKIAYEALDEKKAGEITIIDITGVSVIADYFIIADASNSNQLSALVDNVDEKLHRAGYTTRQVEGHNTSWVLLDYSDIIVHLFSKEDRLFYDLERIWRDGKTIDISEI